MFNTTANPLPENGFPRFDGGFFAVLRKAFFPFIISLAVLSCTEEEIIGLDLIDTHASLETTDTLTLTAMTVPADSVVMNYRATNILGVLNDPEFGKTRASIYAEPRLATSDLDLGENAVLDSINLVLAYHGDFYGTLRTPQRIQIYELSENFPDQDSLFSNLVIPHHPDPITFDPAGFEYRPAPFDSILVDLGGVKPHDSIFAAPHLRVRLADEFGQRFIDKQDELTDVPSFLEAFKGIYITVDKEIAGLGSLVKFNMIEPLTTLELYYQNDEDTVQQMQRFPINEFSARTTRMEQFGYDNANQALRAQIEEEDQAMADSLVFVQSLSVLQTNIQIPYLDKLIEQHPRLLINKAELVIPAAEGYTTRELHKTEELMLLRISDEGRLVTLDDYVHDANLFGGELDRDANSYRFSISRYLQKLVDGEYDNTGLVLTASHITSDMSRVVLHGPGRTDKPIKLILFYSKFD